MRVDKSFRSIALKVMTLTAVFGFLFPLMLVLRLFIFGQDIGLWEAFYNYGILLVGYTSGLILVGGRKGKAPVIKGALTAVLPVAAAFLLYCGSGTGRMLFEGVLGAGLYFIGFRAFYIPFELVLSDKKVLTGAVVLFACMILTYYFAGFRPAKGYITACVYLFLGSVLVINNQRGIDEAFIRRHIDHASIPGNMRRYNISLTAGVFLLMVVLINSRALVSGAAAFLRVVVIKGILLIYWLLMLISSLTGQKTSQGSGGQPQNLLPDLGEKSGNSIVSLILTIFVGLILLAVLYAAVKKIPSLLRTLGTKIRKLTAKVIGYLRGLLDIYEGSPEETDDYQDEVQTLKEGKDAGSKHGKRLPGLRAKNFRGITDPVQKIRNIYGAILHELTENDIRILKSDTTGEVLDKSTPLQEVQLPFTHITRVYDESKYGEAAPDMNELSMAEENYKRIYGILRRRKK